MRSRAKPKSDDQSNRDEDIVLGDDWLNPRIPGDYESDGRRRSGLVTFNSSPLARKIITFNLLGLIILVAGVLFLNPFRESLTYQFESRLASEALLVSHIVETSMGNETAQAIFARLPLDDSAQVLLYSRQGDLAAESLGINRPSGVVLPRTQPDESRPLITAFLNWVWRGLSAVFGGGVSTDQTLDSAAMAAEVIKSGEGQSRNARTPDGDPVFAVAMPVMRDGDLRGVVVVVSAAGEIDRLLSNEREQVLQMFVIAILVSIGLSLVLSSTIANPLADLATAAEAGSEGSNRKIAPERIRIPDLTGRPDEIGRLSAAIRKMVTALFERIDANEQFAADVAHEIKNPLASLRSAVGTMRVAKRDDQRERLLEVIEHDVRRLDRLVSDISNASRLDSELVKEEEKPFDLLKLIDNINQFLGQQAAEKGIEYIADLPPDPITISGLKERLAQVFVNIIGNAISFCEDGDAIRLWVRRRENRVLVVVEDTGPGIPEEALGKIFNRFYSHRPEGQFGNNSGLGLAISKQIVEAHGGVIWAENIRPTDADAGSAPLGARFVVGLPL